MKKKNQTHIGICLMICSSIAVCTGQLLWKLSAEGGFWLLAAGFLLYAIGALVMLYAYRFGRLSVLQPILSLNYVISIFLAAFVLKETVTALKVIGVLMIIAGVIFIACGDRGEGDDRGGTEEP